MRRRPSTPGGCLTRARSTTAAATTSTGGVVGRSTWGKTEGLTGENGNWYGWGRVLDYIGIGWEDVPEQAVQMHIEDLMGGNL